jgi:outer membrane immunogenic protein
MRHFADSPALPHWNKSSDGCTSPGACPLGVSPLSTALTTGSNYNIPVSQNGFIGGGQVGYNYQMGAYLAGLEADIQGIASKTGSGNFATSVPFGAALQNISATSNMRLDFLGTVRGRLGWITNQNFLAYATGGLAYGHVSAQTQESAIPNNAPTPAFGSGNISTTRTGYTVGGGAELMLAPNWTVKAEYLFYDLGRVTYSFGPLVQSIAGTPLSATLANSSVRLDGNIVRVGLNYQFH